MKCNNLIHNQKMFKNKHNKILIIKNMYVELQQFVLILVYLNHIHKIFKNYKVLVVVGFINIQIKNNILLHVIMLFIMLILFICKIINNKNIFVK